VDYLVADEDDLWLDSSNILWAKVTDTGGEVEDMFPTVPAEADELKLFSAIYHGTNWYVRVGA
jgi:hypothetical protein